MASVIMIPGLAVRNYLAPSADALRSAGHTVELVPAVGWRRQGTDLHGYARRIADHTRGRPADVLIGCSVGTQAATLAAVAGAAVGRLLLISPTIDPDRRSTRSSFAAWLRGEQHPDSPRLRVQAHDWVRAGPLGIYRGLRSALSVHLEDELPALRAAGGPPVTIVHSDPDQLSPLAFAADLADRSAAELLIMPDAPHSWPIGDPDRFVELIGRLVRR